MQTVTTIEALRAQVSAWRRQNLRIALVPTMGNLHAGHLKLVSTARQQADKVVVSIFVNPTQFGPNEDFERYPRTEAADQQQLATCHTDLLFLPTVETLYPRPSQTRISLPGLAALHCGQSRPGHFDGVALVVCKLLNMVQPDSLLMGEKDFQQLALIRQMVADLNIPVEVHGVATVREADGLAMSSRNGYLTTEQRQLAPRLYQALQTARDQIQNGQSSDQSIIAEQIATLTAAGFAVDYFSLSRSQDLLPATDTDTELVLLAAARLGNTRLIDNISFGR